MTKPNALIVTRLIVTRLFDMTVNHPQQVNDRRCIRCNAPVGIYPSGQRALREHPGMEIVCSKCAVREMRASRPICCSAIC